MVAQDRNEEDLVSPYVGLRCRQNFILNTSSVIIVTMRGLRDQMSLLIWLVAYHRRFQSACIGRIGELCIATYNDIRIARLAF